MESIYCQYCYTNCGAKLFAYNWRINRSLPEELKFIKSPEFSTSDENDDEWQIIFYLKSKQDRENSYKSFQFGLKLLDCKYSNRKVCYKITIVRNDGTKVDRSFIIRKFYKTAEKLCTTRIQDDDIDLFLNFKNRYYVNCEIMICNEDKNDHNEDIPNLYHNMRVLDENLAKDISSLHLDESFSDVCLEVQDVKFSVHKIIVAARSSVFHAMFQTDMKEKEENVIKINEIRPIIMEQMISFIYTDHVENINAHAIELLKAAEMYDLSGLKVLCENSIFKTFTADNVMELFEIANTYNAENLKKMALNFIKNNIEDVIKTSNFLKFRGSHSILIEIIESLVEKNRDSSSY